MKFFAIVLTAMAVVSRIASVPRAGAADQIVAIGREAPAFILEDVNGRQIALRKLSGHPLFINVFASWCPPCKREIPNFVRQYPHYRGRVTFLGIDEQESPTAVTAFLRQMHIGYLVGIDPGAVGARYGVSSLPQSIFIDKRGIVRAIWRGFMPPNVFLNNLALIE